VKNEEQQIQAASGDFKVFKRWINAEGVETEYRWEIETGNESNDETDVSSSTVISVTEPNSEPAHDGYPKKIYTTSFYIGLKPKPKEKPRPGSTTPIQRRTMDLSLHMEQFKSLLRGWEHYDSTKSAVETRHIKG